MDSLPISVIIATKNAEKTIEECLVSVQKDNPAEIIVVDGVSSDRTVEIARRYTEKIYSDEGGGFNYAQQLGAEQATQEYIALIDSDIVLPEGTLATLLADLKASDCVKMQATALAVSVSTYWERATDWSLNIFRARRGTGGLSAAVLRRDIVLKYKLDSFVKVASDHDFNLRMKKEGFKVGISPAIVYHHHRVDMMSFAKQRFRFGWEIVSYIRVYGPWHIEYWPPLTRLYWLALCLVKGKPNFIPYFVVDWAAETAGMIKGLFEMIEEAVRKEAKDSVQ